MASSVVLSVVDPDSDEARGAMADYFAELDRRFPTGFDVDAALRSPTTMFRNPDGLFVLATRDGDVVACAGVQWLDAERAELKRMWVSPSARGAGIGRQLLAHLEGEVAATGRSFVVLDTHTALVEAIAMYRRAGYGEVEPYNDNPDAQLWFEKHLG